MLLTVVAIFASDPGHVEKISQENLTSRQPIRSLNLIYFDISVRPMRSFIRLSN